MNYEDLKRINCRGTGNYIEIMNINNISLGLQVHNCHPEDEKTVLLSYDQLCILIHELTLMKETM